MKPKPIQIAPPQGLFSQSHTSENIALTLLATTVVGIATGGLGFALFAGSSICGIHSFLFRNKQVVYKNSLKTLETLSLLKAEEQERKTMQAEELYYFQRAENEQKYRQLITKVSITFLYLISSIVSSYGASKYCYASLDNFKNSHTINAITYLTATSFFGVLSTLGLYQTAKTIGQI
jgi:hypothetical protein